jgi:hypothetical protein
MAFIAAALLAAPLAAGCATGGDGDAETGQLVLPLLQPGPDGTLYHLGNATFDVTDSTTGVTQTIDGSGNQSAITAFLQPGISSATLRDGWFLEKSDNAGATYQRVDALLGTPNPFTFRVLANQPVIVEFDFLIRDAFGTLEIKLGVVPKPRELAGGLVVASATDSLAAYADPANRLMDFAVYFRLSSIATATLVDGTKQRIYTALPFGVAGPNQPDGSAVAAEFFNDKIGTLSGVFGPGFTAAFLQYTVAAKPDGTVELTGTLQGNEAIDFGPSAIDATIPTIGADGFPNDEFFYDSGSPFTLTSAIGTLAGTLRVRHLVPSAP